MFVNRVSWHPIYSVICDKFFIISHTHKCLFCYRLHWCSAWDGWVSGWDKQENQDSALMTNHFVLIGSVRRERARNWKDRLYISLPIYLYIYIHRQIRSLTDKRFLSVRNTWLNNLASLLWVLLLSRCSSLSRSVARHIHCLTKYQVGADSLECSSLSTVVLVPQRPAKFMSKSDVGNYVNRVSSTIPYHSSSTFICCDLVETILWNNGTLETLASSYWPIRRARRRHVARYVRAEVTIETIRPL